MNHRSHERDADTGRKSHQRGRRVQVAGVDADDERRHELDEQVETDRFTEVRRAYEVLSNPEERAEYDVRYDTEKSLQWQIFEQGATMDSYEQDRRVFYGILSLLYVARRRNPDDGGLGPVHLEKMLGIPREHLDFPLWYLRLRGWVERFNNGLLAITVDGVDKLGSKELARPHDRLLPESSVGEAADRAAAGRRVIEAHEGGQPTGSLAVG